MRMRWSGGQLEDTSVRGDTPYDLDFEELDHFDALVDHSNAQRIKTRLIEKKIIALKKSPSQNEPSIIQSNVKKLSKLVSTTPTTAKIADKAAAEKATAEKAAADKAAAEKATAEKAAAVEKAVTGGAITEKSFLAETLIVKESKVDVNTFINWLKKIFGIKNKLHHRFNDWKLNSEIN